METSIARAASEPNEAERSRATTSPEEVAVANMFSSKAGESTRKRPASNRPEMATERAWAPIPSRTTGIGIRKRVNEVGDGNAN